MGGYRKYPIFHTYISTSYASQFLTSDLTLCFSLSVDREGEDKSDLYFFKLLFLTLYPFPRPLRERIKVRGN
jgi:hypothetical protein